MRLPVIVALLLALAAPALAQTQGGQGGGAAPLACSGCTSGNIPGYNGSTLVDTPFTFSSANVTLAGESGELFTVNANNGALPTDPPGTLLHYANADSASTRELLDAFGNQATVTGRRADGTRASPTAVQSGDNLLLMSGIGYGATGYNPGVASGIALTADQNWSDTAYGTRIDFYDIADNSTTLVNDMRLQASGGLSVGSGNLSTDPGSGRIAASGAILTAAAPTVAANQIGFGGTVAATGNCGTLSGDAGCIVINVAGTTRYIPYY